MRDAKIISLSLFVTGTICSIQTVSIYDLHNAWQAVLSDELTLRDILVCLSVAMAVFGLLNLIGLELYELFIAYRRARRHERYGERYK